VRCAAFARPLFAHGKQEAEAEAEAAEAAEAAVAAASLALSLPLNFLRSSPAAHALNLPKVRDA
jgi:hypothetical protein